MQGISCKRTISEQPVCNQEKRWGKQTNYKFEKFKQFHTLSPFQNGKFAFTKRSTAAKRFYVQNRPKRRLFLRTNKQKLKKISEISMGRKPIRVPLPLFWSRSSPTNIYKAPKNTNSYPQENNGEDHSVSRRHVIDVKDHKGVVSGKRDVDFFVTKLGLCNQKKSQLLPVQKIEFLGLLIDSRAMTLSLPEEKVLDIQNRCTQLISNPQTLVIELTRLIGKLSFTAQAVLPGRLQHRYLQLQQIEALRLTQSYQSKVVLNLQSLEELQWWKENLSLQNGRPLKIGQADLVIQTDASMTGVSTGGKWSRQEQKKHINVLELLAVKLALLTYLKDQTRKIIHLQIDNMTALSYLVKMGGHKKPRANSNLKGNLGFSSVQTDHDYCSVPSQQSECDSRLGITWTQAIGC